MFCIDFVDSIKNHTKKKHHFSVIFRLHSFRLGHRPWRSSTTLRFQRCCGSRRAFDPSRALGSESKSWKLRLTRAKGVQTENKGNTIDETMEWFLLIINILVGGFKYFLFSPCLGKIPILTHIFQIGWNHQPVHVYLTFLGSFFFKGGRWCFVVCFFFLLGMFLNLVDRRVNWSQSQWEVVVKV